LFSRKFNARLAKKAEVKLTSAFFATAKSRLAGTGVLDSAGTHSANFFLTKKS